MTGMMKKIIRGKEIQVPLSPSFGGGDLYKKVQFSPELCASPGLISALEVAGVLPLEKKQDSSQILGPVFQKTPTLMIKDLLHEVLLLSMDLTSEDVLRYQEAYRRFVRSKEWERSGKSPTFSKKQQLVASMLEKEKKACAAFKIHTDHPLVKAWEFTLASFVGTSILVWDYIPMKKKGLGKSFINFCRKTSMYRKKKAKNMKRKLKWPMMPYEGLSSFCKMLGLNQRLEGFKLSYTVGYTI
jgi:hypothetical protein